MIEDLEKMYEYTEKMFIEAANPLRELLRYMEDEDKYQLNRMKTLMIITKPYKDNPTIKLQRKKLVERYDSLKSQMRDKNGIIDGIIIENVVNDVCPNCGADDYSTYTLYDMTRRTCCQSKV